MPKFKLERDEFSIKTIVPGYPKEYFRAELASHGVVNATDLFRKDLPEGTGNMLLAEAFRAQNALPTKRLVLTAIINQETMLAYKAGVAPEDTSAARCATKALRSLGIIPVSYKYEWADQDLNIVIEMTVMKPLFAGKDLLKLRSLVYNRTCEPSYEWFKSILVWTDERAEGLTPGAYKSLCCLWVARSFLYHGRSFSDYADLVNLDHYQDIWARGLAQVPSWPGFKRLALSERDKAYYEACILKQSMSVDI